MTGDFPRVNPTDFQKYLSFNQVVLKDNEKSHALEHYPRYPVLSGCLLVSLPRSKPITSTLQRMPSDVVE